MDSTKYDYIEKAEVENFSSPLLSPITAPIRSLKRNRPRSRRSKLSLAALALVCFLLVSGCRQYISLDYFNAPTEDFPQYIISEDITGFEPPHNETPSTSPLSNPAFHLLVPVSKTNPSICKTILSSMVLNYPPPIMINLGERYTGNSAKEDPLADKVIGVHEYLQKAEHFQDDDIVLIVDGLDIWFQLPPSVLIQRFYTLLDQHDERLRRQYGVRAIHHPHGGDIKYKSIYESKIIFGADKVCRPSAATDPACASVPESTLPADIYGDNTDTDVIGRNNRPRWLNSGTLMGRYEDVKGLYAYARSLVQVQAYGSLSDQHIFSRIYGEQEYMRSLRPQTLPSESWLQWLSAATSAKAPKIVANTMNITEGHRYEYSIGVDFESQLFAMLTQPDLKTDTGIDFDWVIPSETNLTSLQADLGIPRPKPFNIPQDIIQSTNPFLAPSNISQFNRPTYDDKVDMLPDPTNTSWSDLSLLANTHAGTISPILHVGSDNAVFSKYWERMWFHPWSRALLRKYIRTQPSLITLPRLQPQATSSSASSPSPPLTTIQRPHPQRFTARDGKGGIWTSQDIWMEWGEVCPTTEDEVFGDGMGRWLGENGVNYAAPVINRFGKIMKAKPISLRGGFGRAAKFPWDDEE